MSVGSRKNQIAFAVATALGAAAIVSAPHVASAGDRGGTYVTGDFHNHTTCSDGSISMEKLVKKATDKIDTPWGLDWFVQAGHGGNGNRNCTLVEDATLATPAYPVVTAADGKTVLGPNTTWQNSNPPEPPKGLQVGAPPATNMWRWQTLQEFQYPVVEYLSALRSKPLFLGLESVVAGHEHSSMSVISGQMPRSIFDQTLPTSRGYSPLGNANALSMWEYCFDRGDTDTSRGNTVVGGTEGNNWNCSVRGSANASDPSWNAQAQKLIPAGGVGSGTAGHLKTLEALKWMSQNHQNGSYYVPAHLERAGPFNPDGNNGYNIESLRDFNNAAPGIAFGFETQPGHGAADARGEYTIRRNTIGTVRVDSVGGTTYGGTGVYGAQIGGVWDALLGEGRGFWFFASSDWHARGMFSADDRRTNQDFYPGEYQRDYVMVHDKDGHSHRKSTDVLTPQEIVDGLRSGNSWASSGQLIDRLAFVACEDTKLPNIIGNLLVEAAALAAANNNTDVDLDSHCATMGEKLTVKKGQGIVVGIVVRDPGGTNYSPYTFPNPSLLQDHISQPINQPVLDHVDVIGGKVTGYKQPGSADYSGTWPGDWLNEDDPTAPGDLSKVPAGAKNTSAKILRTFSSDNWHTAPSGNSRNAFKIMVFRISNVRDSQYLRLRGTNMPPSTPWETDADGNPLSDLVTNAAMVNKSSTVATDPDDSHPANFYLKIPCTTVGANVPQTTATYTGTNIDGCPAHLPVVNGQKMVAFDVAAWSDLWFYSNPIFVEVQGGTRVAGVK
jgi:hypothetical protein